MPRRPPVDRIGVGAGGEGRGMRCRRPRRGAHRGTAWRDDPGRFGGLCSGASGTYVDVSLDRVGDERRLANGLPHHDRWPMATPGAQSRPGPRAARSSMPVSAVWSGGELPGGGGPPIRGQCAGRRSPRHLPDADRQTAGEHPFARHLQKLVLEGDEPVLMTRTRLTPAPRCDKRLRLDGGDGDGVDDVAARAPPGKGR